jgi:hypothetical protein
MKSAYYIKPAITIPVSRKVFLSESGLLIGKEIDEKIKDWTIARLRTKLEEIYSLSDLDKFRVLLFSISKALSNHGIAPRWQGLEPACKTEDQLSALVEDSAIIDLFWLSITFPKHQAVNQRWQSMFTNGFGLELATCIGERQMNPCKKIRHELKLSRFQQIGCLTFLRKAKYPVEGKSSALSHLETAQKRSQTHHERELRRSDTVYQVTPKVAAYRALIWECYVLADSSPTNAAKVYKWQTGKNIDKANIARTIKRIKLSVCRKRVDLSVCM